MAAALGWLGIDGSVAAASLYRIDQRYGTITFSITSLGLFTAGGRFARFQGELRLDWDRPAQTQLDVRLDANSIEMPLAEETELLRSPAYFDSARHRTERFVSTSVEPLSASQYRVHGTLEVRGVANPMDLDAVLTNRHFDRARKVEVADFEIRGRLRRSAFGMRADQAMVSDVVRLDIHLRIAVAAAADAG